MTTDASAICVKGYTKTVRDVPKAVKEQAYRSYGITTRKPGEYEIDPLISLELGGSNSIRNLWPESFITQPLNAHVKDKLENKLHCPGIPRQALRSNRKILAHFFHDTQNFTGILHIHFEGCYDGVIKIFKGFKILHVGRITLGIFPQFLNRIVVRRKCR
jgi:hypothetical protein